MDIPKAPNREKKPILTNIILILVTEPEKIQFS